MKEHKTTEGQGSASEAPSNAEVSFGTWLKRQREVREIDLREIAEESKISLGYLQAFEADRFDILPAEVFAKGFLRQYARYVGLEPEEVINFYLTAYQESNSDREHGELEISVPPSRNRGLGWLLVLVLLALLAGGLYWLYPHWAPWVGLADSPVRSSDAPTTGDPAANRGEGRPSATAQGTPAGQASPLASTPAAGDPAADGPVARDPADGEPLTADLASADSADDSGPDTATVPLTVALDFSDECWVEASVDGARQLSELKIQGESLVLQAQGFVELKVGNTEAVQIEVNGRPFRFEGVSTSGVRSQRIDLETAELLRRPAQREPAE